MSYFRTSRLLGPAFEHATVADAMRAGIISCQPDTTLRQVAEMMASYHVHAIVVEADASSNADATARSWRIVSDLDLARAAAGETLDQSAGDFASAQAISIAPAESLKRAAGLMSEHGVNHLLVRAVPEARPVGLVSSLDLVGALAWGRD